MEKVYDVTEKERGDDDNPRAVSNFAKYFLKDVELLPLWSCVSRKYFGYGRIPASSAPVESEFSKIKNHVLRGKTRLDETVETLIDYYDGRLCLVDGNEQPREESEKEEKSNSYETNTDYVTTEEPMQLDETKISEPEENVSFVPTEASSPIGLKKKYSYNDSGATSFVYSEYSAEKKMFHSTRSLEEEKRSSSHSADFRSPAESRYLNRSTNSNSSLSHSPSDESILDKNFFDSNEGSHDYNYNRNVHADKTHIKFQSESTSRRPLHSPNTSNIKCIACQNKDYPSDAHQCYLCQSNVHIFPGCSESIGKEEGYGEKRICIDCFKTPRLDERLSMKHNENWMNLGNSPKKTKIKNENIVVKEKSIGNSQKALYLGQSKEKLKEALTFLNFKSIPVLQNGGNDQLKFVKFPEKVKVSLTNTCAHDSVFQIILAAATDYNEIEVFLRQQQQKCPLFKEVLHVLDKGVTAKVYQLRASILLDFKRIEPQEASIKFVDCADNIGTMSRFLFENVPSFIEGFQCQRGCKPRNIKLPIYGVKKTML